MNSHELVVRIVQPAEQPQLPKAESAPVPPKKKQKNVYQILLNGLGLIAIAALAVFLANGFFNIGFSFKDVLIMVVIPLGLGVIASYAIF